MINGASETKQILSRRAYNTFAYLALKQNKPELAIEAIAVVNSFYGPVNNLKLAALCQLGRVDLVVEMLKDVVLFDNPSKARGQILEETVNSDLITINCNSSING